MKTRYTDEILDKAYDLIVNKKYSANKTSKELGIDNGTMRKRLKEKFGDIFLKNGKKHVNSNFFDIIDSEEKAYWLGFLTADGYISNKNKIELCLADIDKEHVFKFKSAIKSDHKVSEKKTILNDKEFISHRISINDSIMTKALNSYGLNNEKSYNSFIPNNIPNELIRHYIRGLFDGDGSIFKGSNGLNISLVSGSKKMILDFNSVIKEHLDIDMNFRTTRNIYETRLFSQYKVKIFLKWIYEDCTIYLNRKYNKASAVLG